MKILKKVYLFLSSIFIFLIHLPFVFAKTKPQQNFIVPVQKPFLFTANSTGTYASVFDSLKLNSLGLSRQAFDYAITGFKYLISLNKLNNDEIISIVDFSLPSSKKRLFILDLKNSKILFNTYVAHGRNSGKDFANQFSNENESYKSSLGFYVTQDTYIGNHGFSLRLQGEEKGINDNANSRAIVMHSAWYVNENIVKSQGYIGRSQGCPALPEELCKPIIEKIKKGSCLFLYSPDKYYFSHSEILQKVQAA
ncbi:MAG: murein L,D-transpeptidase catalytic domain family protein [Ginsengibacter sp.]